jgi:APA family basic amino acid/polyamine antiporter
MAVAAAALGGADYKALADSGEPLALVLRNLNHPDAARLIALAAVIALPTVIMAFMYGQSRIFFVMARDGMLPQRLSSVSKRTGSPVAMTLVTGIIVAIIAGLLPLKTIAELANAGTLIAFIAVALCMMIMRVRAPQQPRVFATPLPWVVGPLTILGCVYLFTSLPYFTMRWFAIWTVIGLLVYFVYAKQHSALASPTKVG